MSVDEPRVYIATYSNTDVFECTINESPIMRRCKDDWVNATQILKCCNFPKAKRTKILEKGVQQGLHEKIQGGYGRFQGTWIPLEDARRLAVNYGVTPEIAPVLYIDTSDPNVVIPKKVKQVNKDGTPVKRKYTKKAKKPEETPSKKSKTTSVAQSRDFSNQLSYGTFPRAQQMTPHSNHIQYSLQDSASSVPPSFGQSEFYSVANSGLASYSQFNNAMQGDYQNYQLQLQRLQDQIPNQGDQKYFAGHPSYQSGFTSSVPTSASSHFSHSKVPSSQSTNETAWSQDENHKDSDTSMSSNEGSLLRNKRQYQLPQTISQQGGYAAQLLKFFSGEGSNIPYFLHNPPLDFNINEPIDDEGHTPLHWAASIGNFDVIRLLISKGANPLVVNNFGLNPLSKLLSFNNCFELQNFSKVLDDLELCLINTDINGRTPLHYLCQFSKAQSKFDSLNYYLNAILDKLTALSDSSTNKSIYLLKNVIDHQDVNGDTCLHLAVKSRSIPFVKKLLGYDARDDLVNVNHETARYLIVKDGMLQDNEDATSIQRHSMIKNEGGVASNLHSSSHNHVLATPIQSTYNNSNLETPDTQKTTIEDEHDDINVNVINERYHKAQLEHIKDTKASKSYDDNKENIFVDSAFKIGHLASTPVAATKESLHVHQPLAVISERSTSDSSPNKSEERAGLMSSAIPKAAAIQSALHSGFEGKRADGEDFTKLLKDRKVLPISDLTSMVSTMLGSLTVSYNEDFLKLSSSQVHLEESLAKKAEENTSIMSQFTTTLTKMGLGDIRSADELMKSLSNLVSLSESELAANEESLKAHFEGEHKLQLSHLIETTEDVPGIYEEDNKFDLLIKLSELQIQRKSMLETLIKKIKFYGINSKMYKYRKLISLSCGLKVEDIDGLIDGIEESLMETSVN